jgi:hypothetical protein
MSPSTFIIPSTTSAAGNTVLTVTVTESRDSATAGVMTDDAGAILSFTATEVLTSTMAKGTPSATTSPGPTISKRSNLAAVDTTTNDTDLDHHRLIVWQDIDNALVARSAARGRDSVYMISGHVSDGNGLRVDIPKAQPGTPLAAASDAAGDIHVFYVSEEHHTIIHLVLERGWEQRDWVYKGEVVNVSPRSSLSATLHQNGEDTTSAVVVLGYTDLENEVCFKISPPMGPKDSSPWAGDWTTFRPDVFKTLDRDHGDSRAISIASGIQVPADDAPHPGPGDYAGLHVVLEGWDAALVVECAVYGDNMSGCYHSEQYFSGIASEPSISMNPTPASSLTVEAGYKSGPVPIHSHPTWLSWSRSPRSPNGTPPILHGFLTLEGGGSDDADSKFLDHRVRLDARVRHPSDTTTVYYGDMETHKVLVGREVQAMAITDRRALFVRSGTRLFELGLNSDDEEWEILGEVDTTLSEEDGEDDW